MLSCEFCEISKNTFAYRAPPVAASELNNQNTIGLNTACFIDSESLVLFSFICFLLNLEILLNYLKNILKIN